MAFDSSPANHGAPSPLPANNQVSPELFKQGVLEHAVWLGMDPSVDKKYLWIAERSLVAPLPSSWIQLKTADEGHPYYYNEVTQESRWDHPSDNEYRELFRKKKAEQEDILSPRLRDGLRVDTQMGPGGPGSPINYHSPSHQYNDGAQQAWQYDTSSPPAPPNSGHARGPPPTPASAISDEYGDNYGEGHAYTDDATIASGATSATNATVDKMGRQAVRLTAERDAAAVQVTELKEEIEEEMERSHGLMKRCAEAEAKLASTQRQLQRLRMGNLSPGRSEELEKFEEERERQVRYKEQELVQVKGVVRSLKEEVGKLRAARTEQMETPSPRRGCNHNTNSNNTTDVQDCIVLVGAAFDTAIGELESNKDSLTDPKYGEHEVKAFVEEVEDMAQEWRGAMRMKPRASASSDAVSLTREDTKKSSLEEEKEERKEDNDASHDASHGASHDASHDASRDADVAALAALEASRDADHKILNQLRADNKCLTIKLAELEEEIEDAVADGKRTEKKLIGEIDALKKRLEEQNQNDDEVVRELKESVAALRKEKDNLKSDSEDTIGNLKDRVASLTSSMEDLTKSSGSKESDITSQLASLQSKLEQSMTQFDEQVEKSKTLERECETFETKADARGATIKELKNKLEKKKDKLNEAMKAQKQMAEEKKALEESIEDIDNELRAMTLKYNSAQTQLEEIGEEYKEEKEKWEGDIGNLKQKLGEVEGELGETASNYKQTAEELEEAKADAGQAWKKWETSMATNEKLSKRFEKAEFTMNEALKDADDLRAKVDALQRGLDEATEQTLTFKARFTDNQRKIKKLNERIVDLQGNIRVFCRLRPLSEKEKSEIADDDESPEMSTAIQYLDDGKMLFHGAMYEYDHVFNPDTQQGDVFPEVQSAVASAMEGYRVCIFAYGQTGSGKTHTMEGPRNDRGVNFRALEEMFELAESSREWDYDFSATVLEVYNETVRDLLVKNVKLARGEDPPDLPIRVNSKGDVFVEGLNDCIVEKSDDVEELMQLASGNRNTANNNVNTHSSRSHLVLSVKVTGVNKSNGTKVTGKLNLIDLAGSERLKNTAAEGQRLKEAQSINKSLSALGDVINALGKEGKGKGHVPYRNSKLTFLLQDSLRSSAKVLMFVNINPAPKSAGESICSLNFAARCRAVQLGKAKKGDITVQAK